jgi:hypothetical protein
MKDKPALTIDWKERDGVKFGYDQNDTCHIEYPNGDYYAETGGYGAFGKSPEDAYQNALGKKMTNDTKKEQPGSSVAAGVRFSEELKMKKLTIEQRAQNIVDRKDICNDVLLKKYIVRHFELAIKATNDNTAELKPSLYLRNALLGVKYEYERIMKAHNSGNAIVTDDERDNMKNDLLILNELL